MGRVILHCDANSFYASVECLYTPSIRSLPVAVCGNACERHGIVLTKNPLARSFGVKTGEAVWKAREKCPGLVCVPPDFPLYIRFSRRMRRIYEQYSDRVESFGLDEAWIDLSGPGVTLREGGRVADAIRLRVREELGITVSVGVADNKVFAKLGSDMKKPDAVTVLAPDAYKDTVYPLPAGDLLFVGPSTRRRLAALGILTIGDLARCDPRMLQRLLGKSGPALQAYASGQDRSPVMAADASTAVKSIGNSTTPSRDLENMDDARSFYYLLAESVAARLRDAGLHARCVSIHARSPQLVTRCGQTMLSRPSNLTDEIAAAAMDLFTKRFSSGFPYRSVGLTCTALTPDNEPVQLDFTGDEKRRMRMERLERSIDALRRRYGHPVVTRGVVLHGRECSSVSPEQDSLIHPIAFHAGRERA